MPGGGVLVPPEWVNRAAVGSTLRRPGLSTGLGLDRRAVLAQSALRRLALLSRMGQQG